MKFLFAIHLTILASLFMPGLLISQEVIKLSNPSFEDTPRAGSRATPPIKGWVDCGLTNFPKESPPDIMPTSSHAWGVDMHAIDGETYISMVVRNNDTWESISQKLETNLHASKCYSLDVFICRSITYKSRTRLTPKEIQDFTHPVVLQIWGGNSICEKKALLARSEPIENYVWQLYSFNFQTEEDYSYITFEAFYKTPTQEAYNGHLFLDDLSPIIEISCEK